MANGLKVWLQGGGEMATGAAVALVEAGYRVVIAEQSNPCAVRRLVAFSEAIYEGRTIVAGVKAYLRELTELSFEQSGISVAVDPLASQLRRLAPDVVVDARMTKRNPVPLPSADLPLIGLGPGFDCGVNADLVVETMRGGDLGRVLSKGGAAVYTGVPGDVGGETKKRLLRAPAAGNLIPNFRIGDLVSEGEIVAQVGGQPVVSRLNGILRGLVHPRAELIQGQKVGDVDPRGAAIDPKLLSDKALLIGAGVRRAVGQLGRTKIDRMQGKSLF